MRPDWTKSTYQDFKYNLSNNVCIDQKFIIPAIDDICLRTYPDEYVIYEALSQYHNVDMNNISIGYGLGELIQRIYLHLGIRHVNVISPTWLPAEIFLKVYNIPYTINSNHNDTIYLSNPNGLYGNEYSTEYIKNLLSTYKLVIVDEAYMEFGTQSMIPYLNDYDNLLVLRTISKSLPLPGIRLGYCMGNQNHINKLQLTRPSCVASGVTAQILPKVLNMIPEHIVRMKETKEQLINLYNANRTYSNFVTFSKRPNVKKDVLIRRIDSDTYRMSLFNKELLGEIFNEQV